MSSVIQVEKKVIMSQSDIIRFQILTHCYLEKIPVSDADLDCLAQLTLLGDPELTWFCQHITDLGIFQSIQSVRNVITKAERKGLIVKDGRSKKKVSINPRLKVQAEGTILLDYKFLHKANAGQ